MKKRWMWLTPDDIWDLVIIAAATGIALLVFVGTAKAAEIEWFAGGGLHLSNINEGEPLHTNPPGCEPTYDWFGGGATIVLPKHELDLAHGFKWRDKWCGKPYAKKREQGSLVFWRWYPKR